METPKIKIALIEDEETIRDALLTLLYLQEELEVVAAFSDGESALSYLEKKPVDVLLFDIQLPGISGIEVVAKLKVLHEAMQCMALTSYDDATNAFNALKAGATGYILKNTGPDKLVEAIKDIHMGGSPMSSQVARLVVLDFAATRSQQTYSEHLSRRENEILQLLSKGFRYKEIAAQLYISIETVRTHIRNIYEKLQVKTRAEALSKINS
ncbi:response regulator [Niabella insulamsoli]|uniref:response regulator transcription factor n=1 Tax=Niabella insulamsoli TaxID=3144874 RepID=UPI0031FC49A7